jgi:hypothetical protein
MNKGRHRKYLSPRIRIGEQFIAHAVALLKSEAWRSLKLTGLRKCRLPPCGRGLSKSPWCEIRIVQGVPTCPACNCMAPGKVTLPVPGDVRN